MSTAADALRLKEEGNALFEKKKYKKAMEKYTAAIEKDERNAVLYSNRAACALHLHKYLNASEDAEKATKLDPSYTKAWGRLGTAEHHLGHWDDCIKAWQGAIASLPSTGLSVQQKIQKGEFQANIMNAKKAEMAEGAHMGNLPNVWKVKEGDKPVDRAQALFPEQSRKGPAGAFSCVWLIVGANRELSSGAELFKLLKRGGTGSDGRQGLYGHTGTFQNLTNALLRDPRMFHASTIFLDEKIKDQGLFELSYYKGWGAGSADYVLREAAKRLRSTNWEDVRGALTFSVRGYILRAVASHELAGNSASAVAFLTDSIDIMERGRSLSPNIPEEHRGAIFTRSFSRGVKALLFDVFIKAHSKNPEEFPVMKLKTVAEDVLNDIENDQPTGKEDTSVILSFWVYPRAKATAALAFYECSLADQESTENEASKHWENGAALYVAAARKLPADEEMKYTFTNNALKAYWKYKAPLHVTMPLLNSIKDGLPKMKRIWEYSKSSLEGNLTSLEDTLRFGDHAQKMIAEGKCTLESALVPDWM